MAEVYIAKKIEKKIVLISQTLRIFLIKMYNSSFLIYNACFLSLLANSFLHGRFFPENE